MSVFNWLFPKFRFLSTLLIIFLIAGCGSNETEEAPDTVRPVKIITVGGLTEGEIDFPGVVEAGRRLVMSFRVSGRLTELPIKEGDEVAKGQLIARLDPVDYQIAVQEARASYTRAEADYQRYRKLYEKDAVALAQLDFYQAQRDIAKARLEEAQKNLGYTYLRAPFSGIIGNRYIENFMDVQAQQDIVDLNDITQVDIKIQAPENLVAPLKRENRRIRVEKYAIFDAASDKRFPLTFKEVSSRADPATQTFELTFMMPQPEEINLLPGMTASVKIIITLRENYKIQTGQTVIPAIAVIGEPGGGTYVWSLKKDMTVQKTLVKVGEIRGSSDITITEGLKGGDQVVIAGMSKLQDGMKVRRWEEQK